MIKLSGIFSDHALYLHSATLTVSGVADNDCEVSVALTLDGEKITCSEGRTDENGRFSLTIDTPAASFDTYDITVSCGEDRVTFGDILFGELWLASGQSNMEMPNRTQDECDEMLDSLSDLKIRVFYAPRFLGGADYPEKPLEFYEGYWVTTELPEHKRLWEELSATATAWARHLYMLLQKQGKNVPVGFADLSKGGASMQSFLSEDAYLENKRVYEYFDTTDKLPTHENWNTKGEANYQQVGAEYNLLIAPTRGVKYRGILWYQGECNLVNEYMRRIYGDMLSAMRRSYKKIFGAEGDTFPLIASQIYPWIYAPQSGECRVAYINKAISDLSDKYPKEHLYIPVCDLRASFEFSNCNHPIHPTHKYEHGERMALICENACYGRHVKGTQKLPAKADKIEIRDGRVYVTFKNVGTGLHIEGRKLRGIYIRSKEGIYTPAESYIVDKKTLCVYHPFIEKPAHVAYAASDFEHATNLYAGEFPVTPFATDMNVGDPLLNIEIKSFTNMDIDGEIVYEQYGAEKKYDHMYRQPIFYPAKGTTCVYDTDFSRSGRSLRLKGETNRFGAYVLSRKYHRLDLENYREMRAWFLNTKALIANLTLTYKGGEKYTVFATQLREVRGGWGEYSFCLENIPMGDIDRIQFNFEIGEENPLDRYVNIDNIMLVPKM